MEKKIIGVFGTTHLATVIASSFLKKNFKVILFELDIKKLNDIKNGKFTIYEPYIEKVIKKAIKRKKINFSNNIREDSKKIDVLYYAKDSLKTKYGINEKFFADEFLKILNQIKTKKDIILSSQLPVGTCQRLLKMIFKINNKICLFYIPEFLRLGNALNLYLNQDYIIIGSQNKKNFLRIKKYFQYYSDKIYNCSLSEAEFSKHFANIYVANTVSLVSELTSLGDFYGVNFAKIAPALRNDERIGSKSYIYPGLGFTGGNIERDIKVVSGLMKKKGIAPKMLNSITSVNEIHNNKPIKIIFKKFKSLKNINISFLGVTYKDNTNTLNGSLAVKYAKFFLKKGAIIKMFDPMVSSDTKIHKIKFCNNYEECIKNADILIIMIVKEVYKSLSLINLAKLMNKKNVLDLANMYNSEDLEINKFNYAGLGIGKNNFT